MSKDAKRVLITAIIGFVLAVAVMAFEIWKGYSACIESNLGSYVVTAMWFDIFTIAKNGAEYIGTPEPLNMLFIVVIYVVVLVSINEISRTPSKK